MFSTEVAAANEGFVSTLSADEDLAEIVHMFVDELPSRVTQLLNSLEDHQLGEVARFAHQLKGAGGSYGYPQLTPVAARVEVLAKQFANEMTIRSAIDDLVNVVNKIRAAARR
ncbi:Hpt domain-containing protein [Anatilimnocola sp. NA78]|uniref:Hpt domain-containing protein n=1 Tax=Anatilimnocola sp. NA78 TaxID=3415683 RepID=UPI003CE4788D